jgi:hypothetical protein
MKGALSNLARSPHPITRLRAIHELRLAADDALDRLKREAVVELECVDEHKGGCGGGVALRPSLTGTGTPIPRCDVHWIMRLEWQAEHQSLHVA